MRFCARASHAKNRQLNARGNAAPAIDQRVRRIAPLATLRVAALAYVFFGRFLDFSGGPRSLERGAEQAPEKTNGRSLPFTEGDNGVSPPFWASTRLWQKLRFACAAKQNKNRCRAQKAPEAPEAPEAPRAPEKKQAAWHRGLASPISANASALAESACAFRAGRVKNRSLVRGV